MSETAIAELRHCGLQLEQPRLDVATADFGFRLEAASVSVVDVQRAWLRPLSQQRQIASCSMIVLGEKRDRKGGLYQKNAQSHCVIERQGFRNIVLHVTQCAID